MKNEFQPFVVGKKNTEFNATDFEVVEDSAPLVLTEQQEFLAECERLKDESIQKGYAEGLAKAQAEIDEKKLILDKWIKLIQRPVHLMDDQLVREVVQTMIWICTYCIGIELSTHPEKLQSLFMQIKDELPALKGNTQISMHPDDIELAKKELGSVLTLNMDDKLVPDPSLNRGDFYLKGDNCELDGRMHTRFVTLFAKYLDKEVVVSSNAPKE